jgi:hypothetical protein
MKEKLSKAVVIIRASKNPLYKLNNLKIINQKIRRS